MHFGCKSTKMLNSRTDIVVIVLQIAVVFNSVLVTVDFVIAEAAKKGLRRTKLIN